MQCLMSFQKFVIDMRLEAMNEVSRHCMLVIETSLARIIVTFCLLDLNAWRKIK